MNRSEIYLFADINLKRFIYIYMNIDLYLFAYDIIILKRFR